MATTKIVPVQKITCTKCLKTLKEDQFYTYRDGRKFDLCKQCTTMHIDNFDPQTYTWLLQKLNYPYVPEEWNTLLNKAYAKDPAKINGMSVFGKYLSKMKLKQWKQYTWADTPELQERSRAAQQEAQEKQKQREVQLKQNLEKGIINEAEYKTLSTPQKQAMQLPPVQQNVITGGLSNPYVQSNFLPEEAIPDPGADLTQEDKIYLAMKWGRLYTPAQWVQLERKYIQMTNSFDIQDSDTIGTLILLCKTYLKLNQAIDNGDMDGYSKLSRSYDSLRKSAKFTAAQNKQVKEDYVDCIGNLVVMCEKQGFIPRYLTEAPQDVVDKTLQDMNNYAYQLVTKDLGLGQRIEDQLKKMQIQQQMEKQMQAAGGDMQAYIEDSVEDEDHQEFYDLVQNDLDEDAEVYRGEQS